MKILCNNMFNLIKLSLGPVIKKRKFSYFRNKYNREIYGLIEYCNYIYVLVDFGVPKSTS